MTLIMDISLYRLISSIRNKLYDKGIKKSFKADVPTLCVGNVTVGGTGKTPHVEMVLRMLMETEEWKGKNLAVLSRGYKRDSKGFQQVTKEGSASLFGDEPLQIKKKFPSVTVAVDKDRIEGCRFLAHPEELRTAAAGRRCRNKNIEPSDIVILDDAYQYRRLKAECNVVLVNYNRPVSQDRFLPFGRLRDLPGRIYDADVIIVSKCNPEISSEEKSEFVRSMGFKEFNPDTFTGVNPKGREQIVLFTCIGYEEPQKLFPTSNPRYFYSKKLVLFSGVANSDSFRNYLSDNYKVLACFDFGDHHKYVGSDIRKLLAFVKKNPTVAMATTEKDAQRVLDYEGMPQTLIERMFYVPIHTEFVSPEEKELFRGILTGLAKR